MPYSQIAALELADGYELLMMLYIEESMSLVHINADATSCNEELIDIDCKQLTLVNGANDFRISFVDNTTLSTVPDIDIRSFMLNVMSFPEIPS